MNNLFKICAVFLVSVSTAFAAEPAKSSLRKDRSNLPITVKSNDLAADNKGKIAVFTGKVVAKHGDITIFAEKLTVSYGDLKGEVEKVEAEIDVRIVQENRIGTAAHATYQSKEGLIVLTGKPKILQGTDSVSGKTITYYLDEDRSVVTGGGDSRVEAVIHPPDKKNNVPPR
jgi:lipopolysaccharide export system protein LptA